MILPNQRKKFGNLDQARGILGTEFISPDDIPGASCQLWYSDDQLGMLYEAFPIQEELVYCRDHGFTLIAGPPNEMSLLDIWSLKPDLFSAATFAWCHDRLVGFSRDDKIGTGWIALHKGPVANSFEKNWEEQQALISEFEFIPNAAAIAWVMTVYRLVRGVSISDVRVRTSSRSSDRCVIIGDHEKGISLGTDYDHFRYPRLGVAVARKIGAPSGFTASGGSGSGTAP